jgi:hypothetical protein
MPFRPIAQSLGVWLAIDRANSAARVSREHLEKWHVPFDTAFEVALENLRNRSAAPFQRLAPGLYTSAVGDTYDASRMLLAELFDGIEVRGAPVATAPNRNMLLITGTDERESFPVLAGAARKVLHDPRPLSASTFVLADREWSPYAPEPGRAEQADLIALQEERANVEYGEQKSLLDQLYQKEGRDIYVAGHSVRHMTDTGKFVDSFTVWSSVDSLLPRAQRLVLHQPERKRYINVAWDDVVAVVRPLMEPQGWWPERYRVVHFPDADLLDRLVGIAGTTVTQIVDK